MRISPSLSLFLSTVLVVAPSMPAAGVDLPASGEVQEIHLRIVSPDSASQSGKQPNELVTVEVVDDHGSPVPNASVLFRLPSAGSSGVFRDGSRVALVYTDGQGIATIQNIHWDEPGQRGTIKITATKGTAHAGILVEQPIVVATKATPGLKAQPGTKPEIISHPATLPEPVAKSGATGSPSVQITNNPSPQLSGSKSKKWLWISLAGAGAVAAGMAAMGGKSHTTSPATPSGSPQIGSPTISIGHP
jgi:hypothetical protein